MPSTSGWVCWKRRQWLRNLKFPSPACVGIHPREGLARTPTTHISSIAETTAWKIANNTTTGGSVDRGVIYLLTGPAHAVRLVVSLWSLRRHYQGPVTLFTTQPQSHVIGQRCQADDRLRVEHRQANEVSAPKN